MNPYTISCRNGSKLDVEGDVIDDHIGVRLEPLEGEEAYAIDHIPTGRRITLVRGHALAVQVAAEFNLLGDWSFSDPGAPKPGQSIDYALHLESCFDDKERPSTFKRWREFKRWQAESLETEVRP